MKKFYLVKMVKGLLLVILLVWMGLDSMGQIVGDLRSTGNSDWNVTTTWERFDGLIWEASGIGANNPGQIPTNTQNVFIQSTHVVTLTSNAVCFNLNIAKGNTVSPSALGRINLGANTLSVFGFLRNYLNDIGIIDPATDDAIDYNIYPFIVIGGGKISVEGSSRDLTNVGSWSGTVITPTSGSFPLEINMDAGESVSLNTVIKVTSLTINTGTLDAQGNKLAIDNGNTGQGDLTINVNGTLMSSKSGSTGANWVASRTQTTRAGTFNVYGKLFLSGSSPYVEFNLINFYSGCIVEYSRGTVHNILRKSLVSSFNIPDYKNLIKSGIGILNVNNNIKIKQSLNISAGTLALGSSNITILSDATETASVSPVIGTITYGTGRFIIERYLPAFKAWRFISTPIVIESTPTISESWREGNSPLTSTGYGVQLTGPSGPVTADNTANLDLYSIRGSMKKFLPTNAFAEITDANTTPIANKEGYFVFVTGDRGTPLNGTASPTNLRIKGKILTGDQPYTVGAVNFLSVGNPFASRVDFRTIANGTIAPSYYAWNPNPVGTLYNAGKYETYINYGDGNYRLGNITGPIKNYIESGQSIIIQSITGGSITIKETDKTTGSANVSRNSVEGLTDVTDPTLEINLFTKDVNGSEVLADVVTLHFGENFSNQVDNFDVRKISNSLDNLSVLVDARRLTLNRRNTLTSLDTIFLNLTSTRVAGYSFQIDPSVLGTLPLKAWLKDKYLQIETPVSLTEATHINFTITADAASRVADRFMIIFKAAPAATFLSINATTNNDKTVALQYIINNENNVSSYKIERSNNSLAFNEIGSDTSVSNLQRVATYQFKDDQTLKNDHYYRIKMVMLNSNILYSDVVKVSNPYAEPAISISPNPVNEKTVYMQFINSVGNFSAVVLDIEGKKISTSTLTIKNIRENKMIALPASCAKGIYKLVLTNEKGKNQTITFMVL